MVLAVVLGALAGFLGFVPLFASLKLSRYAKATNTMTTALYGLVGVFVSLVVVIAGMIICSQVARGLILPFGITEILALILSTSVYMAIREVGVGARSKKKER